MGSSTDPLAHLSRRRFLRLGAALGGATLLGESFACSSLPSGDGPDGVGFVIPGSELEEATLGQIRAGMETGRWTSLQVTDLYLARIQALDGGGPRLSSVIETNPSALEIATEMDLERAEGRVRSPLHGIPILLKETIGTRDHMTTTAGSLALEGSVPLEDSEVARRLRAAGAVILGKTNLSEWSGFRSSNTVSGWSARGGLTLNPYALDRSAGGSSSGSAVAVAASLCAVSVGVQTNGSIIFPASLNGIVGIRPTVGLISRRGVIPVSETRDTPGPMARTVEDAAVLLGALVGADAGDPSTEMGETQARFDYTPFLDPDGLKGMRIGVARQYMGHDPDIDGMMERALGSMKHHGADLVDPAEVPDIDHARGPFSTMLHYELKATLNEYLESLGPTAPVRSLEEIVAFNRAHPESEMPHFGQEVFELAARMGPLSDMGYKNAKFRVENSSRMEGLDWVMDRHGMDAMIAPSSRPAWRNHPVRGDLPGRGSNGPGSIAGYPAITVPMGSLYGLPVGISFFGRAWSEPFLIRMAYAFEQATKHRKPPSFQARSTDRVP